VDCDADWLARAKKHCRCFSEISDEFEKLIVETRSDRAGRRKVGKLSADLLLVQDQPDRMLRAGGVNYDIRKVRWLRFLSEVQVRIPLGETRDTYDRLMMRTLEMRESISILKQAFEQYPPAR